MKKLLLSALVLGMALFMSCSKKSDSAASSGDSGGPVSLKRLHETYQKEHVLFVEWNEETQTWDTTEYQSANYYLTTTYNWDGDKLISWGNGDWAYCNLYYNNSGLVSKIVKRTNSGHEEADTVYLYYNEKNQIIKFDRYEYKWDVGPGTGDWEFTTWDITYSNDKPVMATSSNNLKMQLTWTGDNITEIQYFMDNEMFDKYTYTYDNSINPTYGFNCWDALGCGGGKNYGGMINYASFSSKNNVLHQESLDIPEWHIHGEIYDYTYKYNGNYPIEREYSKLYENATHIEIVNRGNRFTYLD